jgi:tRNA 2-thiocytidine biosynthesis protein TtcA
MSHIVPSHMMDRDLFGFTELKATGVADAAGDRAFDDDETCASPGGTAGAGSTGAPVTWTLRPEA